MVVNIDMDRIVIATHNKGKVREIRRLLHDMPFEIVSLDEIGYDIYVEEDQLTFEGNAVKKAIETMKYTGEIAIADDSGLEVCYLNGQPGVYSARYAGNDATDEENMAKLLRELEGVPQRARHAVFKCSIVMVYPHGRILKAEGICEGRIGFTPKGSRGFGYDPIFVIDDRGTTFAQLEPDKKNKLSHRGKALRQLKSLLEEIYKES